MMISIFKLFGGWALASGAVWLGLISPSSYADEKIHDSGTLYFYGALFSSTCSLSDDANVIGIDMGTVNAAELNAQGSVSQPVQFRLTGPDMLANKFEGVAYVQIIYL
ncbi:fimbrial protein [Brenneria goodwinii]|uniref:Fimbrial protein n=1 Tax=Brenneria goodwinii TaxID=1109412 RepID=A0A0G4JP97_9GAMM|nr:type 1 fimbrial protein [Brenneria goodwinii]CPR13749.1 hypothetical protein BN1221_00153c [Brenneria goodwinii]